MLSIAFQTLHDNTNCKQQSMVTVGNYNIDNGQYKQRLLKKFNGQMKSSQ